MKIPSGIIIIGLFFLLLLSMVWIPLMWWHFTPDSWHSAWWFGPVGYTIFILFEGTVVGYAIKKIVDL